MTATKVAAGFYVSDIEYVRENPTDKYDVVVTCCQDEVRDNVSDETAYYWFNMADGAADSYGGDSSYGTFEVAASTVMDALEAGQKVLCHCHMGQSRSVAVAIAALAVYRGEGYWDVYDIIDRKRDIHPDETLEAHALTFIAENGN